MYRRVIITNTNLRPCIACVTPISVRQTIPGWRSKHDLPMVVERVSQLPDWNTETFRQRAFIAKQPAKLPFITDEIPRACRKWFIHDGDINHRLDFQPKSSELKSDFWSEYGSVSVPLELTSTSTRTEDSTFHRSEAPLEVLLAYLSNTTATNQQQKQRYSIYLAQCDLHTLPKSLVNDIPTPKQIQSLGKGDIYSSSLWLGRPPTYTSLHRDPNPNMFLQLAGHKIVRLFPPEIGNAIFDDVQEILSSSGTIKTQNSASFRGEEMMRGPERDLLHRIVWGCGSELDSAGANNWMSAYALEARLGLGEALFIPTGWWHSVKGVGEGITASANWWFR